LIERRRAAVVCARLVVLSCLVIAGTPAAAEEPPSSQPYVWRSWSRLDGLPGSQVWAITQDRSGYIWIGTNEGLVRFDGVRFVTGRQLGLDLPNASVRALGVARDGGVWIGFGTGGIGRLLNGRLQTFSMDDGLPPGVVGGIVEDARGSIWAANAGGLYRFQDGRWERIALVPDETRGGVNAVYADSQGRVWVGTPVGVYRSTSHAPAKFKRVASIRALSFAEDDRGRMWVGGSALMLLSADPPRTIPAAAAYAAGQRMVAGRHGRLWIGTLGDGLLRVSHGAGAEVEQVARPGVPSYDVVLAVFEDREGNVWVGTPRGLDRGSRGLIHSLPGPGDGVTPPVQAVATASDGSVWVGTQTGLHRFASGVSGTRIDIGDAPPPGVVALHGDPDGRMWVVNERSIGRVEHGRVVPVIPAGTQLSRPVALTTDRHGTLWICDLERGLFTWDGTALRALPAERFGTRTVFSILADRQGRIWAGHLDGTISVHEDGRARLYTHADGVAGSVVTGFFEDAAGTIWAGSRNGLMRFRDGRYDTVARDRGLPGHTVTAITGDDSGNLWIGVSAGIARLRPDDFDKVVSGAAPSLPHTLYDGSDGLRGDPFPFTAPGVTRGGDGRLWFLTSDGVSVVSPGSHTKNRVAPPVLIETVSADDRPVSLDGSPRLPPRTASLQIDYAALSFVAPEKVRFTYLMEGFDSGWIDAGTRRQAFYTNLPPGNYRFRVRASNDGVPAEREAVWAFTLAPAFYQTGWFAAAMGLLALSAAALVWQARVRQVRGRYSAILVERTRVAREIHDTLLQSLLGVMFRLDDVSNVVDISRDSAKEQLLRLRRQVEFYVREARYSIRDLRSPILQSRGLATALREVGERLTEERSLTFRLDVTGTPRADLQRVDEHLLRIGQEAITNAVRHGHAAAVDVALEYRVDSVALRIRDDGKGFDTGVVSIGDGVHWGMRTMRERAEQIGGTLRVDSAEGRGTTVDVVVPVPPSNGL
jgi:signal transduction histidine kinase/ligand-binding sensor domain-containing protein